MEKEIQQAAEAVRNAQALLITAGAGIGVDSGLPDFRGNEGFWKAYPPIAKLGISFSEMANPMWFESNPELAWAFYGHRLNLYRQTAPHDGFRILLEYGLRLQGRYFVFTSNVDGHFQKAGFSEERIEECHGSINHFQCVHNCTPEIWPADDTEISVDIDRFIAHEPLPVCPHCGGLARPNILMFGDWGWISQRSSRQSDRLVTWLRKCLEDHLKIVVIELGAGEAVPTVRHQSEYVARQTGSTLIRINPRDYWVPDGSIGIPTGSLDGIKKIFASVN
jgi:NAD-dependent SIR2 family protein deacetylase